MTLKYEVEVNQFVIRVYDETHKDNYIASALVRKYGDRGWMSSIVGEKFYEALKNHLPEVLEQCQVRTLEGYMTAAHARLLRMALREHGRVTISHWGECAGRSMPWVVLTASKKLEPLHCNQCGEEMTHMGHGYFYCASWKSHQDPESFL